MLMNMATYGTILFGSGFRFFYSFMQQLLYLKAIFDNITVIEIAGYLQSLNLIAKLI